MLKNWAFWLMFAASLFVGALSFAVILEVLTGHDWDIYIRLNKTFWQFVLLSMPYLWIVCLLLFSAIAYYDFVHTKGWYHHSVYAVVSASIIASLFLGTIMFYSGIGKRIDRALDERVPFYGIININKRSLWCHPDKGLLGGRVIRMPMEGPDRFIIIDCKGNEWEVRRPVSQIGSFVINIGEKIKVIGKEIEMQRFEAEEIRRW